MSKYAYTGWTLGEVFIQVVTLTICRFPRLSDRLWVFSQMALARPALWRAAGLEFWKLCGSGSGEGFTPRPNTRVWAILAVWSDADAADQGLAAAPFTRWTRRAEEAWTVRMTAVSSRGSWSRRAPFRVSDAAAGPIAVLTRGTIRPLALMKFWQREPAISEAIGRDPNVLFKIGIGEVPWRNQVTFSIWPDAASIEQFAHRGPHAAAIRAVRRNGWFAEELYARFAVVGACGTWGGVCPLAGRSVAA